MCRSCTCRGTEPSWRNERHRTQAALCDESAATSASKVVLQRVLPRRPSCITTHVGSLNSTWHARAGRHHPAMLIDAMDCKNVLGEIDPDEQNSDELPLPSDLMRLRTSHRGFVVARRTAASSGRGSPFHSLAPSHRSPPCPQQFLSFQASETQGRCTGNPSGSNHIQNLCVSSSVIGTTQFAKSGWPLLRRP